MAIFLPAQDKKENDLVYDTPEKMYRVLAYINKSEKTEPELRGGVLLNDLDNAYNEMMLTKQLYRKTNGRMVMHYYQSFSPGEVTPEKAKEIADQMVQHKLFKGFQISYATHTDKKHIHTHFVVNTVNMETGYKWQLPSLKILQDYSDELCREHGLSVIKRDKNKVHKSLAQKEAEQKGKSWKKETQLAVDEAMKIATSKADFISIMKMQGYGVRWDYHKYINFTNPKGKMMRNRLFDHPERYTKEALEKRFEENRRQQKAEPEEVVKEDLDEQSERQTENSKEDFSHIRRETFYAVRDAKNVAVSREDFISILNSQGYNVRWDEHKYITFQKPEHRAVRNRNFYPKEKYTKEALLEKFEKNRQRLENIKSGKYQNQEMGEGERTRGDLLYLLTHLFSGNQGDYPHQEQIRNRSAEAIEDWQKEQEKGEGMDWEQ